MNTHKIKGLQPHAGANLIIEVQTRWPD